MPRSPHENPPQANPPHEKPIASAIDARFACSVLALVVAINLTGCTNTPNGGDDSAPKTATSSPRSLPPASGAASSASSSRPAPSMESNGSFAPPAPAVAPPPPPTALEVQLAEGI